MRRLLSLACLICLLPGPALASTTFVPPPAPASVAQGKFVYESIKSGRKNAQRLTEVEKRSLELYLHSLK